MDILAKKKRVRKSGKERAVIISRLRLHNKSGRQTGKNNPKRDFIFYYDSHGWRGRK